MSKKSISNHSHSVFPRVSTWIIENYLSYFCENEDCLVASLFLDEGELEIKLFPRGASSDCLDFISLFLEMKTVGEVELDCKLEVLDREGNAFVANEFRVRSREQKWDIGFPKFISINEVLYKMAKSNYDSLIINCHMRKIQSETYSVSGNVETRTIIGIEMLCFTFYLENLENDRCQTKHAFFPKSSEMKFKLSTSETHVTVMVIKSDSFTGVCSETFDEIYRNRIDHYNNNFFLCKISFMNLREKLLTQLSYLEFEYKDEDSEQCCYTFRKDLLKSDSKNEILPLQCEICLSYSTYTKHINSEKV